LELTVNCDSAIEGLLISPNRDWSVAGLGESNCERAGAVEARSTMIGCVCVGAIL